MRWRPIVVALALIVAGWTLLLWLLRMRWSRMGDAPSPQAIRGYRVHTSAAIAAAVGFTWFAGWGRGSLVLVE